jgi:hypothetical protein
MQEQNEMKKNKLGQARTTALSERKPKLRRDLITIRNRGVNGTASVRVDAVRN